MEYHSGRVSVTFDAAAASLMRAGVCVPMSATGRLAWFITHASAMIVGDTPCASASFASAAATRSPRASFAASVSSPRASGDAHRRAR